MKKVVAIIMAALLIFAFAGCGNAEDKADVKSEGVMTYAEYDAAEIDADVVIETYVQAKQGWWQDAATVYTQDKDGAYFLYSLPMTQEQFNNLKVGTKIKVTGKKAEWKGEIEVIDATFEIEEGSYIAKAVDVTSLLGTDELIKKQNQLVAFKDMKVEEIEDKDGEKHAFLYNWDGSGAEGSNNDLYFKVSSNGKTYTFTVESYLCGEETDVYKAVTNLKVGDTVDLEGFLYWYDGANPHITSVKVK